ncbi:hypothetical protein EA58_11405 [Photobacterium galatheae]|uniref:Uncharacterized protein n=2 Tax=Photobacterium galatheae TaxID=1654360 RepID=A0A066RR84_9GAMM|nr:hypothetical protein EA58_11405 [Photobacterium galatheae]
MPMSLLDQSPKTMTLTADTASERVYLPAPIDKKLLLADADYVDFSYFEQLFHRPWLQIS